MPGPTRLSTRIHKRSLQLSDLPPRQKGVCRWCGAPVPKGRRSWCSQTCVDEYLIRSNPEVAAKRVYERDRGVCVLCGTDTGALRAAAEAELARAQALLPADRATWGWRYRELYRLKVPYGDRQYDVRLVWSWPQHISVPVLWQVDHIVPVAEGGGACGLDGLRTLCLWCHQAETGRLRRRLNAQKRLDQAGGSAPR